MEYLGKVFPSGAFKRPELVTVLVFWTAAFVMTSIATSIYSKREKTDTFNLLLCFSLFSVYASIFFVLRMIY
jgi:hypothetical protein